MTTTEADQPCNRTDLPELADMHCPCGFEAGEHPAWLRRMSQIRARREAASKTFLDLIEAYGVECAHGGAGSTADDSAELREEIERRWAAARKVTLRELARLPRRHLEILDGGS